jgi:hypothetical protein
VQLSLSGKAYARCGDRPPVIVSQETRKRLDLEHPKRNTRANYDAEHNLVLNCIGVATTQHWFHDAAHTRKIKTPFKLVTSSKSSTLLCRWCYSQRMRFACPFTLLPAIFPCRPLGRCVTQCRCRLHRIRSTDWVSRIAGSIDHVVSFTSWCIW